MDALADPAARPGGVAACLGPLYPFGASWEARVKDLVAGAVLLVVMVVAAAGRSEGRAERSTGLVLGAVLVAGALILDDGVGAGSIAAT